MPEPMVYEVQDFVDFLLTRPIHPNGAERKEARQLAETDMSDYASNLDAYGEMLARGQIKW